MSLDLEYRRLYNRFYSCREPVERERRKGELESYLAQRGHKVISFKDDTVSGRPKPINKRLAMHVIEELQMEREKGLPVQSASEARGERKLTEEEFLRVKVMHSKGESASDIADKIPADYQQVNYVLLVRSYEAYEKAYDRP